MLGALASAPYCVPDSRSPSCFQSLATGAKKYLCPKGRMNRDTDSRSPYATIYDALRSAVFNLKPYVRVSGECSPAEAAALRKCFPGHTVSGAVVAIDFDGPGTWSKLRGICEAMATPRGLRWRIIGDDRPDGIRKRSIPSRYRDIHPQNARSFAHASVSTRQRHTAYRGVVHQLQHCRLSAPNPFRRDVRLSCGGWPCHPMSIANH